MSDEAQTVENTTTEDNDADVHDPATAMEEAGTGNGPAPDAETGNANKEAAKYRVRAREAQAERDGLAQPSRALSTQRARAHRECTPSIAGWIC